MKIAHRLLSKHGIRTSLWQMLSTRIVLTSTRNRIGMPSSFQKGLWKVTHTVLLTLLFLFPFDRYTAAEKAKNINILVYKQLPEWFQIAMHYILGSILPFFLLFLVMFGILGYVFPNLPLFSLF